MMLVSPFCAGPSCYIPFIGLVLAALGAASALCAFLGGRRFFGTAGGVIAGIFVAVWIDAIYFGPRTFSDTVAAHLLVIGLYANSPHRPEAATWQRAAVAGGLLILSGSLRIQLMPAIAVIGLWTVFSIFRRQRLAFLGSGLLIGLLYGAVDGLTWGYPFEALWRNIVANLYYHVAAGFGIRPWYWYPATMLKYWTGLAPLMLALCLTGARRLPQLFVAGALIAATYSLIGHKELRFIYPAILLAIIVSGIGLAQFVSWISEALHHSGWPWRSAMIVTSAMTLAVVVLTQLALASGSELYRGLWTIGDKFVASRYVARLDSVCGIGVLGNDLFDTGGYTSFHHAVPLYWGSLDPDFTAFNTVVYDRGTPIGRSYVESACFGDSCVAQRPGTCSPVPMKQLWRPPGLPKSWQPKVAR
jgi:hypothetical protein